MRKGKRTVADLFRDLSQFFSQTQISDLAIVIMYIAIAITFGTAFSRVLNSLIEDIVFPTLTPMINNVSIDWRAIVIGSNPGIAVGNFLTALLSFGIISIVLLLVVRILRWIRK